MSLPTGRDFVERYADALMRVDNIEEGLTDHEQMALLEDLVARSSFILSRMGMAEMDDTDLSSLNAARRPSLFQELRGIKKPQIKRACLLAHRNIDSGSMEEGVWVTDTGELLSIPASYTYSRTYGKREFAPEGAYISIRATFHGATPFLKRATPWKPDLYRDSLSFQPVELVEALAACIELAEKEMMEQRNDSLQRISKTKI